MRGILIDPGGTAGLLLQHRAKNPRAGADQPGGGIDERPRLMMAGRQPAETALQPAGQGRGKPQEGGDTMTRSMEKKLADAKAMADNVVKLDRTAQVYILGEITARLLCKQNGNKTA